MIQEDGATETISRGCSENGIEKSKTDRGSFCGELHPARADQCKPHEMKSTRLTLMICQGGNAWGGATRGEEGRGRGEAESGSF